MGKRSSGLACVIREHPIRPDINSNGFQGNTFSKSKNDCSHFQFGPLFFSLIWVYRLQPRRVSGETIPPIAHPHTTMTKFSHDVRYTN